MASKYTTVSATATSQTIGLGGTTGIALKNEGTDEIYYKVFYMSDPEPSSAAGYAATTADAKLTSTDSPMSLDFKGVGGARCISVVCDTAETATLRIYIV